MKVRDLKKKLEKLPDNLDVKMLLPIVDDWADIKIEKISLFRIRREVRCKLINRQNEIFFNKEHGQNRRTDYTPEEINESEWEINDGFTLSLIGQKEFDETYETREAVLIVNKSRNKSAFDRVGNIEY